MKLIFLGSAEFGQTCLEALCGSEHELSLAVLRPDRKVGRGQKLRENPLKTWCRDKSLSFVQVEKVNAALTEHVQQLKPDLMIVVSYGEILKKEFFRIPRLGCMNIHASLLPHLRGPAPIEWAIANGDTRTGLTAQFINEKMDTGDILDCCEIPIDPEDTALGLRRELLARCGSFLVNVVGRLASGHLTPVPQDASRASYCRIIKREDGHLDWVSPAGMIINRFRAFCLWPGLFSTFRGKGVRFRELDLKVGTGYSGEPGEIVEKQKNALWVACGRDAVGVKVLQPENKRAMAVTDFINGYEPKAGEKFV